MEAAPETGRSLSWQRTVKVVAITQAVTLIGFNFSYPFLPLFIQELGVTDRSELALWTGISIGGSGIVMALASPVWGLLADRFGRKSMLVRSVAAGAGVLALQSLVGNVGQLLAMRLVNGAFTGTQTAGAMLLAGVVPRDRTGSAMGVLSSAAQVGNLIGPVLGGIVVVAIGLRSSFLVGAGLLALCTVATILYVQDAPRAARELPSGVRGNIRDVFVPFRWPGLRGVLVVGLALQVLYSGSAGVMAIYVQDLARPAWLTTEVAVGLAFALGALAAAAAMPVLGTYADRSDPRRLLAASVALVGVSLIPQTIVPSALVFLACRVFTGIGLAGVMTSTAVLTRMGAPVGAEGRAFGALAAVQNLGWGTGPIVGSVFAAVAGIPALYLVSAALMLATVAVVRASPGWFARRVSPPVVPLGTVQADG